MTTWTCKGTLAALALTSLAACDDGRGGALLRGLNGKVPLKSVALSQANMAFGAVTLVAPKGFCIDKNSLRQNFALMARCETLGAPSAGANAPVGILTASFSVASTTIPTPSETAAALSLNTVTDPVIKDRSVTFRAQGAAPAKGLSETHWRGTARAGSQMMALALYGPTGGRAIGAEGRDILDRLINRLNVN
ncbi:MAG: hypothetical protein WA782_13910 [Sulfitobacter sp.]